MTTKWARTAFLAGLNGLKGGTLTLRCPDRTYTFGDGDGLDGMLTVHNERFFLRALTGSDIGIGESFMDGDWSTPDVVPLARLMLRNRQAVDGGSRVVGLLHRLAGAVARRLRDNSITGSKRNIRQHYDLGNDFFRLFLDTQLSMYSCGYFGSPSDSLETAQARKVDRICGLLGLGPSDHVLEIGSGWGGFAAWASTHYGCRVTTTTISDEQYRYVRDLRASLGDAGARIEVLRADYRELTGRFDKVVSIEMFEAVGLAHYDDFFATCNRVLKPGGQMLLQTITTDDWRFDAYRSAPDWIERYIFPGSELASVQAILTSLKRHTKLGLFHAENIGVHYALTLRAWRARFLARLDEARALGYDERFVRMWDLYLAYCEAAFAERHIGNVQLLLTKAGVRGGLFEEPGARPALVDGLPLEAAEMVG